MDSISGFPPLSHRICDSSPNNAYVSDDSNSSLEKNDAEKDRKIVCTTSSEHEQGPTHGSHTCPFLEDIGGKRQDHLFLSRVLEHYFLQSNNNPSDQTYPCPIHGCRINFPSLQNMWSHLKICASLSEGAYQCPICGKVENFRAVSKKKSLCDNINFSSKLLKTFRVPVAMLRDKCRRSPSPTSPIPGSTVRDAQVPGTLSRDGLAQEQALPTLPCEMEGEMSRTCAFKMENEISRTYPPTELSSDMSPSELSSDMFPSELSSDISPTELDGAQTANPGHTQPSHGEPDSLPIPKSQVGIAELEFPELTGRKLNPFPVVGSHDTVPHMLPWQTNSVPQGSANYVASNFYPAPGTLLYDPTPVQNLQSQSPASVPYPVVDHTQSVYENSLTVGGVDYESEGSANVWIALDTGSYPMAPPYDPEYTSPTLAILPHGIQESFRGRSIVPSPQGLSLSTDTHNWVASCNNPRWERQSFQNDVGSWNYVNDNFPPQSFNLMTPGDNTEGLAVSIPVRDSTVSKPQELPGFERSPQSDHTVQSLNTEEYPESNTVDSDSQLKCHHCSFEPSGTKEQNYAAYLRKHIKTHEGQRPIPCEGCHRTFTRKDNLTAHTRRQHSKSRDFAEKSSKKRVRNPDSLDISPPRRRKTQTRYS